MNRTEYYEGDVTDKTVACPFRGEHDAALFCKEKTLEDWFYVQCVSCGARGPTCRSEETALEEWNDRKKGAQA